MSSWFLFICFLLFNSCKGYQFNVTRVMHGDRDDFSNMDPSGSCPRKNDDRRAWCLERKGDCGARGCCICTCIYQYSTFRMEASPKSGICIENSAFRQYAGCSKMFATISVPHPLVTLNLAVQGSKGIDNLDLSYNNCYVVSANYLDQKKWKDLDRSKKSTFDIRNIDSRPNRELTWTGNMSSSYFGYIMKINGECRKGHSWKKKDKFCVVFKTKGTLTWNFPDPTTQAPSVTSTISTTTKTPTTEATAQVKSTAKLTATTIKTTSPTKAPISKQVTTGTVMTKPSTETLTIDNPGGTREPKKAGNKLSNKQEIDNGTMIGIIGGVAAVICVAVILLCLWLVCQRRKNRNPANYGAGTTVIANPTTGSQNHFPMPGLLKNPIFDDSVYAEPEEKARQTEVGLMGDPSQDRAADLLLNNPGAKDARSTPLNNIRIKPLNTASRKIHRENTYASAERCARGTKDAEKPVYDNPECVMNGMKPVYQSLVKEDARVQFNSNQNCEVYQSLNPDGMMYQPLQKNTVHRCQDDIPEYLVLLNPNESPRNISLTPPEYQPPYSTGPPPADAEESPEYADYADLDELEEIAAKEGSNKRPDKGPSYASPVYNALEGPSNDYACPGGVVYDVLEGPDSESNGIVNQGFELPMYAVLEGPDTTP